VAIGWRDITCKRKAIIDKNAEAISSLMESHETRTLAFQKMADVAAQWEGMLNEPSDRADKWEAMYHAAINPEPKEDGDE
jgi:hypothetical protein